MLSARSQCNGWGLALALDGIHGHEQECRRPLERVGLKMARESDPGQKLAREQVSQARPDDGGLWVDRGFIHGAWLRVRGIEGPRALEPEGIHTLFRDVFSVVRAPEAALRSLSSSAGTLNSIHRKCSPRARRFTVCLA